MGPGEQNPDTSYARRSELGGFHWCEESPRAIGKRSPVCTPYSVLSREYRGPLCAVRVSLARSHLAESE
jgi:hypothetical protein